MKCLTVGQPWTDLIVKGIKDVENRSWATKYRGPLLIHAAGRIARCEFDYLARWFGIEMEPSAMRLGAILGAVDLVDCRKKKTSRWHKRGRFGWYFENPRRLRTPLPYRGQLGIYDVPDRLLPRSWR